MVISTAVVSLSEGDNQVQKVLKMSGIGKFPFVSISSQKLDFEELTVGQSETKKVILKNQS